MLNPYARIRELERELYEANLARVKAEDDCRLYHSQLVAATESEAATRKSAEAKSERFEDWMAALMRQPPIHGASTFEPKPAPEPTRKQVRHGAVLESQRLEEYEKELGIGIDPVN